MWAGVAPQHAQLEVSDSQLLLQKWRKTDGTGKSFPFPSLPRSTCQQRYMPAESGEPPLR